MILFAYAIALLAVAWAVASRGRPWLLRLDERRQQRIRLAGMAIVVLVGAGGAALDHWCRADCGQRCPWRGTGRLAGFPGGCAPARRVGPHDPCVQRPEHPDAGAAVGRAACANAGPGPGITGVTLRGIGARRPGCQLTGVGAAGAWLGRWRRLPIRPHRAFPLAVPSTAR